MPWFFCDLLHSFFRFSPVSKFIHSTALEYGQCVPFKFSVVVFLIKKRNNKKLLSNSWLRYLEDQTDRFTILYMFTWHSAPLWSNGAYSWVDMVQIVLYCKWFLQLLLNDGRVSQMMVLKAKAGVVLGFYLLQHEKLCTQNCWLPVMGF